MRLDAVGDYFIWMQSGAVNVAEFAKGGERRSILIANSAWASHARLTGLWDQVIELSPTRFMRNPIYRLAFLIRIRRLGAALLVQPRAARVFLQEDAIVRVSSAKRRIGNGGTFLNINSAARWLGDRFYDQVIRVSEDRFMHETIRNAEFVKELTFKSAVRFDFRQLHPVSSGSTVVIAVGAGQIGRVWPLEKLASLIGHIMKIRPEFNIVLLGAKSDQPTADRLIALVGEGLVNLVGETSLREFVDLVASARFVVSNDSSAFHVAVALGKNAVCFLGGGHYGWYAPYPVILDSTANQRVLNVPMECYWCNWDCKYPREFAGALRCVAAIEVKTAIEAVDAILVN